MDALLTYAWCRSSYAALRSLSRLGVKTALADSSPVGMGQASRLKARFYRCRSFLQDADGFTQDVIRVLEESGARFLLPGHDETEVLALRRQQLPPGVILPVASAEQLALANDKEQTAGLAERLGLPVPRRLRWQNTDELRSELQSEAGPWVVKLRKGNSAKGVFYPQSSEEAVEMVGGLVEKYQLAPERYPIVQQRVEGDGWGVSCLYWEGKRLASFTHQRLREKTQTGGTSTLRQSARNPVLEEIAHRLLDELEWHGLAMVEFKYDASTGQGWFIEINPRLWGSIHLAIAAGVDFPALLYLAATQGPRVAVEQVRPWTEGLVARWYLGECIAAAGQLKRGKVGQALKMLAPGGADTYDDWFWDDPGAMFGQAAYYLSTFLRSRSLNPEQEGMLG